jgi:predicted transcriptional regulator YdeE
MIDETEDVKAWPSFASWSIWRSSHREVRMEPKRIEPPVKLLIAGVTGKGNETARLWESYTSLSKSAPIPNKAGTSRYEIRLYSEDKGPEVTLGQRVKAGPVRPEYQTVTLPESRYAVFEVHPANGYDSENVAMDEWLKTNGKYRQVGLDDKLFAILVYDDRYKGEADLASVVECWVPVRTVG